MIDGVPSPRRRIPVAPVVAVCAIVLLAGLVRVAVLATGRVVWGDEPFYLWLGRNWVTGQGYSFTGHPDIHHTPLLPLLSGLLYLLTGDMQRASDIIYLVFGALLALPVYGIGRVMYSHRVGLLAALLVSIWPAITISVAYWGTMTEPLYYFFIYCGTLFGLLSLKERGLWAYILTGASFGLAYLTRPEAVSYLAVIIAFIALVRFLERTLFRPRVLLRLAAIVFGYALLFLPYAAYVHGITGEWMISEKAGVTYILGKSLAYGDTALFDRLTWGLDSTGEEVYFFSTESYDVSMVQDIVQDPMSFARMVYLNTRRFIQSLLSTRLFAYWLLLIVALGWFKRPWSAERLKVEFYLLAALSPILLFLIFFIQDRYIAAIVPGLIVWLASGLAELQDWLAETAAKIWPRLQPASARVWLLLSLPILFAVAFLAYSAPRVYAETRSGSWRPEHKTIGLWLRDNVPPGGIVMSRYPTVAFYGNMRWVPTPNAGVGEVLHYARIKGASYWVIDERETGKMRPQFAGLMQISPSADLILIHEDDSTPERLMVYRVVPQAAAAAP